MHYQLISRVADFDQFDCLVLAVLGDKPGRSLMKLDTTLAPEITAVLKDSDALECPAGPEHIYSNRFGLSQSILLLRFSNKDQTSLKIIHKRLSKTVDLLRQTHKQSVLFCLADLRGNSIRPMHYYRLLTQYCETALYQRCTQQKKLSGSDSRISVTFFEPFSKQIETIRSGINQGRAIGQAINLARKLSDLPANRCTPEFLAQQALELSSKSVIRVKVHNEGEIKKLGMNCLLAVSRGSAQAPKMIEMHYPGSKTDQPPVVLIGKGLTFDSGGYSIKSAANMDEMKFDMCGGAAVMATVSAACEMKLPINLIGIIPSCENLINGRAFKPGDVLTSMSGQTVEILSTDAEGRLLLADSLTYARRFDPAVVINVATLTGACIRALGYEISGLMSNDRQLSNDIVKAGSLSRDYVWPLPLWPEYNKILDSNFADMASSAGRDGSSGAGAIVAASFLSRFTQDLRWAHLDVAGTAWKRGKEKGATGRPVTLLCQYLISYKLGSESNKVI